MRCARVQVPWKEGLHLRPATTVARIAQAFQSTVTLRCGEKLADARSIMSVLLLTASMGSVVEIEATGEDEVLASKAMEIAFGNQSGQGD